MAYFFIVLASLLLLSCNVRSFKIQLTREHVQRKSCIGWVVKKICAKSPSIPHGVLVLAIIIAQSVILFSCIWLQLSSMHTIKRITKQSGIRKESKSSHRHQIFTLLRFHQRQMIEIISKHHSTSGSGSHFIDTWRTLVYDTILQDWFFSFLDDFWLMKGSCIVKHLIT